MVLIATVHLDCVLSDDRISGLKLEGDVLDESQLLAGEVAKFPEVADGLFACQRGWVLEECPK